MRARRSSNLAAAAQNPCNWADTKPVASGEQLDTLDPSALRLREASVTAGVWLTYVLCAACGAYTILTWTQPHRMYLAFLFGIAGASGVAISLLPRERIVRSRYREPFFLTWTILDIVLIACATLADEGTASPISLIFLIPVVFAATTYPLGSVATTAFLTVGTYIGLAIAIGGAGWSVEMFFTAVLVCAGSTSAWQARHNDRQRNALSAISRTDALTGCLNRRGFEERALGEISAAARHCRQGAVLVLDLDHFKAVNDEHGHGAGDELLCWVVQTLERVTRSADAVGRIGGDEFAVLFAEIDPATALLSAARVSQALGERAPCSIGLATFPMDGEDLETLMREADMRLYASRSGRAERGSGGADERLSWAAALAHAVDLRMNPDHEHSAAVSDFAVAIARRLGWREREIGMLRIAAMLHDVGKVNVPDSILGKPGPLEPEEREAMMKHAHTGAELVARIDGLEAIVPWIRHCHESFDGSGYPDGLHGEAIPLASRILLVADAFDAITSSRPYRDAMSVEHARSELLRHSGTQFDPTCVHALLEHLDASVGDRV
jgi:diguanylate cyclase (GGDEF)-like protein/putative nucleotidyltransferase with HDIG domain